MTPEIALNDGRSIPQLGFGTWPLMGERAASAVHAALTAGYRHIDTARRYQNERGVGEGIRRSGLPREDVFVTTKLDGKHQGGDRAIEGLRACLERLGLDYVDLLLIHWPLPDRGLFVSTWRTFEKLQAEGLTRSIGVSNFKPAHLTALMAETEVIPAVNQVQLSPVITRTKERAFHDRHGIVTVSYSPIKKVLREQVLRDVAAKHGRTPAQIALRWHVQQGLVAIPKSSHPERMAQNLQLFDFELDDDDLARIATLDAGPGAGVDSDRTGH